jgi:hypothetical protein
VNAKSRIAKAYSKCAQAGTRACLFVPRLL